MPSKPTLTTADAVHLLATGHAVHPYPRKLVVCVDGYKHFQASKETIAAIRNHSPAGTHSPCPN